MTEALRACECGRTHSRPFMTILARDPTTFCVMCGTCPACTAPMPSEEAARAAWNRRAPVALPSREEVVEVIRSGRAYEATSEQIADAILNLMRERMG